MDQRARVDELEELREQVAYLEGVIRNLTGQDDDPVPGLTPLQCRMVRALERAQGRVLSYDAILDALYWDRGADQPQPNMVNVVKYHICRRRPDIGRRITVHWGHGYALLPEEDAP